MRKSKVIPIVSVLLVVLSLSCFAVYFGARNMQSRVVADALLSRKIEVNLIATGIEQAVSMNSAWGVDEFDTLLKTLVEELDLNRFYIQLFDEEMNGISMRYSMFGDEVFDPRAHPEFLEYVMERDKGTMTVRTDAISLVPVHDICLYFRWIPLSTVDPDSRLLVVGSSAYTVERDIGNWLLVSVIGFLPFMVGLIVFVGVLRFKNEKLNTANEHLRYEIKEGGGTR